MKARIPSVVGALTLLAAFLPAAGALLVGRPVEALEVPYLTGRVVDEAEILDAGSIARISALLKAHEDRTTNQVAVLTVPSLQGESIEDFASRVFESWRLGQGDRDNGVLILVAPADRRMRIEVGYGLEGTLTDLIAGRIIRDVMTPPFREGRYDAGVEAGTQAVVSVLEGGDDVTTAEAAPAAPGEGSSRLHFEGPDLSIAERILIGAFVFGIIGLFTFIGIVTPGAGWFLYVFLIPFWAMFPIVIVGTTGALVLLASYVVLFPIVKVSLGRASWYRRVARDLKTKGTARLGGFTFGSSGSAGHSWSSGGGSSSSSFSGGGGSSGGGGASGSW